MAKKPSLSQKAIQREKDRAKAKKATPKPRARKIPPTPATNTEVSSDDAEKAAQEEQERIAAERQKRPSENT